MNILETNTTLTLTVPISAKFKRQAELFRSQQINSAKAHQVFYNTLAVSAVNFYCQCLGIKTDLQASDSWNPITQTLADVADLYLENLGYLECRPVLSESDFVEVPAEVWSQRIGYFAVQFNAELTEAKILGFLPKVTEEEIPLNEWRSLEDFLEHLECLNNTVVLANETPILPITKLSQWLEGVFEAGWESLEVITELLEPSPPALAWRFRKLPKNTLGGAKLIELKEGEDKVDLLVRIEPVNEEEFDVEVEVFSRENKTYLPEDLQLAILDHKGEEVMQAIARSAENIQLDFSVECGESFQVKLSLGDTRITELFQM